MSVLYEGVCLVKVSGTTRRNEQFLTIRNVLERVVLPITILYAVVISVICM